MAGTIPQAPGDGPRPPDRESALPDPLAFAIDNAHHQLRAIRVLGQGTMGYVVLCEETWPSQSGSRRVAVKISKEGCGTYLQEEVDALRQLAHPGIGAVFHTGMWGSCPYMVMEFVEGESLETYCRGARATVNQRVRLALQCIEAVRHIHHKGLVHCDFKTTNTVVLAPGRARVIDFGLARAIGRPMGGFYGTPGYAAPETHPVGLGLPVAEPPRDVFAIAVALFHLFVGASPFSAGDSILTRKARRPTAVLLELTSEELRRRAAERSMLPEEYVRHVRCYEPVLMRALEPDARTRIELGDLAAGLSERLKRLDEVPAGYVPAPSSSRWALTAQLAVLATAGTLAALFWLGGPDGWLRQGVDPTILARLFAVVLLVAAGCAIWPRSLWAAQRGVAVAGVAMAATLTQAGVDHLAWTRGQIDEGARCTPYLEATADSRLAYDPGTDGDNPRDDTLFVWSNGELSAICNPRSPLLENRFRISILTDPRLGAVTAMAFHRFPTGRRMLFLGTATGSLFVVDDVAGRWELTTLLAPADWVASGYRDFKTPNTEVPTSIGHLMAETTPDGVLRSGGLYFGCKGEVLPLRCTADLCAQPTLGGGGLVLYIADAENAIHRLVFATGNPNGTGPYQTYNVTYQTVLAGNDRNDTATAGTGETICRTPLNRPTGVAIQHFDGYAALVVTEGGDHRLRRAVIDSECVSAAVRGRPVLMSDLARLAGDGSAFGLRDGAATEAMLHEPSGVAVLASGAIIFSEYGNHTVRMLDRDRVVSLAGTGVAGQSIPNEHRRTAMSGAGTVGTVTRLNSPAEITPLCDGSIVFLDAGNAMLQRIWMD